MRSRWLTRVLLGGLLLIIGAGIYIGIRAHRYLDRPIAAEGGTRTVTIARGQGFRAIVDQLHADGIVTDRLVFEGFARIRNVAHEIEAGRYTIDLADTPRALLKRLTAGSQVAEVQVTLPEGLNKWQVADILAAKGLVDRGAFLEAVDRGALEGMLFPDTYRFAPGAGVDVVLGRLTGRFEQVYAALIAGHTPDVRGGEGRARVLNMASIIEKEARTERDRRLIARVIHNRLAKKMRLQVDPTCMYAADRYGKAPHPRYCKDPNNRYSTYVIDGLPPTPIANPGRAAIAAALSPPTGPEVDDLLYFVARRDGTGEHAFSATYAEHRAAVQRYLKKGKPSE